MIDISFEKIILIIAIILVIILLIWQYHMFMNNLYNQQQPLQQLPPSQQPLPTQFPVGINESNPSIFNLAPMRIADATRNYDYHAFADPLAPPYRRDEYRVPLVGIPTKGYPSTFKKMATLTAEDESVPLTDPYKFLFLMGREKYAGANSYDYYAVEKTSEGNGVLKFNLHRITREYNSGDEIYIHELKRKYRVRMDELDGFRYDPYIIF